jgi:hypothetical protein
MKQQSDLEKRLEQALSSLDGLQRATPQPWLFSRVKGKLLKSEEKTKWEAIGTFLSKPAVAIAGLILIMALNGVLVFNQESDPSVVTSQTELVPTDSESLIASSSSFDFENLVQP